MEYRPEAAGIISRPTTLWAGENIYSARWGYDAADPLAVSLEIDDPCTEEPVRWTFLRGLLNQGLREPAGEGDIAFCPDETEAITHMTLYASRPGERDTTLTLPERPAANFLGETYGLVSAAAAEEAARQELDALLTAFETRTGNALTGRPTDQLPRAVLDSLLSKLALNEPHTAQ